MRVNLRRRDVGVSEHLLNRANVRRVLNQMRRKTVPQSVRRNAFETDFFRVFFDEIKDRLAIYRLSRRRDKKILNLEIFLFAS